MAGQRGHDGRERRPVNALDRAYNYFGNGHDRPGVAGAHQSAGDAITDQLSRHAH